MRRGTHLHAPELAPPFGFIFVWHGIEKKQQQNMLLLLIYFIAGFKISPECCAISSHTFVIWCCGMIWIKCCKTFCCVFQYQAVQKGTNMGSRVWWLAKFAWCDDTWKPSIMCINRHLCQLEIVQPVEFCRDSLHFTDMVAVCQCWHLCWELPTTVLGYFRNYSYNQSCYEQ